MQRAELFSISMIFCNNNEDKDNKTDNDNDNDNAMTMTTTSMVTMMMIKMTKIMNTKTNVNHTSLKRALVRFHFIRQTYVFSLSISKAWFLLFKLLSCSPPFWPKS